MKYTDRELDRLLEKLIASTRSPRGKFSAAASYQILEKRLPRPALRLFSLRTLSAVAAIALLCFIGWNTYCYLKPAALQTISTLADTRTIKLPDGTEVTLNHFSSLTYPEKFKGEHRFYHLPFQTISQARNILLITKLLQSKQKIKYLLISLHISLFGCIFGCQFSNTPNYEYQKKHHFRTGKPEEKRRANHRECTYPYACDIRKPAHRVYNGLPH